MARETFENWLPVEYADTAIQRPQAISAMLNKVPAIPMKTESKVYPRSGAAHAVSTAKGTAFTEDSATNDKVTLNAVKFGLVFRIANEDIDDTSVSIVSIKQNEFGVSYAYLLDNACLGTTAAGNLGTVPFNSLYYAITQADSNTSYSASANLIQSATGSAVTYNNLSDLLNKVENSQWWSPSQIVIAHPTLKNSLREIKDSQNRPIFVSTGGGTPDTLFDYPISWSLGASTSAVATDAPTGHPLVCFVNPNYLMLGDRGGVKAKVDTSVGTLDDTTILAMQARNAFVVGVANSASILEVMP